MCTHTGAQTRGAWGCVPSSRRRAEVDEHTAAVQKVVLFVQVNELERRTRAVALLLRKPVERVLPQPPRTHIHTCAVKEAAVRTSLTDLARPLRSWRPHVLVNPAHGGPTSSSTAPSPLLPLPAPLPKAPRGGYLSRRPLPVFFCVLPMVAAPQREPSYGNRTETDEKANLGESTTGNPAAPSTRTRERSTRQQPALHALRGTQKRGQRGLLGAGRWKESVDDPRES